MNKKEFINPTIEVVKIQNENILQSTCMGQACLTEELCEGEEFDSKEGSLDFGDND